MPVRTYSVRDHALLRWMERVMDIDVKRSQRELQRTGVKAPANGELARYIAARDGLDLSAIREDMLSPTVKAGLDAGMAVITDGKATFGSRDGHICTVIFGEMRGFGKRRKSGGSAQRAALCELGLDLDMHSRPVWSKKTGAGRSAYFQKVKRFAKERDEARR